MIAEATPLLGGKNRTVTQEPAVSERSPPFGKSLNMNYEQTIWKLVSIQLLLCEF